MGNVMCPGPFEEFDMHAKKFGDQALDFFGLKRKIAIINKSDQEITYLISSQEITVTLSSGPEQDNPSIVEVKVSPKDRIFVEFPEKVFYVTILTEKDNGSRWVFEKNALKQKGQNLVFEQKDLDNYEIIPTPGGEGNDSERCVTM